MRFAWIVMGMPSKPKKQTKEEDWFEALDKELAERTSEVVNDIGEKNTIKESINKTLVEDFWKIWLRFHQINIHFTMEPTSYEFARFDEKEYPYSWDLKDSYNFGALNKILLIDRTQDQGRIGDSVQAYYYREGDKIHIRLIFEYCEGEHYYKYSGWKRIFTQYVIYDQPLERIDVDKIHDALGDVIKSWYESHLRRNRQIILDHMKDSYEKGETFTQ